MESRYQLTDRADQDLFEVSLYLARVGSIETAEVFLKDLRQKFDLLAENPGLGRRRPELSPDLQSIPQGKYVIFYRPTEQGIVVVRVLHGSRDVKRAFGETEAAPEE